MGQFRAKEQLKSLLYIDRSLRGERKKYKLIEELNFKNLRAFIEKDNKQVLCWIPKKCIIHRKFFDANNIFSHLFIQNIKHKPILVHDLSIQMKISLKIYIYIGEQCQKSNTPNITHH